MFTIEKISGGFAVIDWNGIPVIAYRNRKHADQYAFGATYGIFNEAEIEYDRRARIGAYLAERATRVYKPVAQLELFA